MALVVKDRVKETCSAPGVGTVTLLGASTGYVSFATVGNGNTTYYCIADQGGSKWEVGIGTYTSSGTTLSRDTVLSNSSGNTAKIDFSSGTQDVFVTYPSERAVYVNDIQVVSDTNVIYTNSGTVSSNTTLINNGAATGPVTINNGVSFTVPNGQRWVIL